MTCCKCRSVAVIRGADGRFYCGYDGKYAPKPVTSLVKPEPSK